MNSYRCVSPSILLFSVLLLTCPVAAQQPPSILTRAFDNQRSGANLHETVLTPALIRTRGVRRITTIPVTGDARGIEAQPLVLSGVKVQGAMHNVMVLPSMANVVRGVEASTGAALWETTLCRPANGGGDIDMHLINDKWGVLSTGVIDPDTGSVYLVAWCSSDGTPQNSMHFIYVLNIADGSQTVAPISLANVANGTQRFASTMRKQRSSLVMTKVDGVKTIFFASGSVMETAQGSSGWIIAFDAASNRITASLAMSQGLGAGVWMGGQGLAADAEGYLYGITGNGSYNGTSDFGECVFKLQYVPPTATTAAQLHVIDSWAPFSDAGRIGENPELSAPKVELTDKLAGVSSPSQLVGGNMTTLKKTRVINSITATGEVVPLVYPIRNKNNAAWSDEDFGSSGGTLIEPYNVYFAAGKDGLGYAVNSASLGHTQPHDFANPKANCAKLKSPPVWVAASPGPVDPCPQDVTTLNFFPWGKTRHIHATPVQYWSPTRGLTLFVWGENSQLHAWTMSEAGTLAYLAQGNEVASAQATGGTGGMPGGFCTLSSNQNQAGTALLWCTIPYGDANANITNGRLLCYDPEAIVTNADGSKSVPLLWDSERWGLQFVYNKFNPPIVWNGQVYVPNYNGGVDVYGP